MVTISDGYFWAASAVVQSTGKIVLAGAGNGTYSSYAYDFAIARLNTDGTQDTTFGGGANDGVVLTDFGDEGGDLATSIVLLSGDKLLVAGGTDQFDQSAPQWALAEYNADGTPDTLFGSSGVETINMGENYGDTITAAALSGTSGAFYVVGQTGDDDLTLLARNADGSADTLFGSGGEAEASFGGSSLSNAVARAVTVDASGNIVVAGTLTASGRPEVALARFTSAGALDGSFGFGGKFTDTVSTVAYVNSLAMTSAGYLVVGGMAPSNHFMVSEYDPADTVSTASTSLSYTVVQRFVYTPYGQATVLNADWSPSTATFGEDVNGWVYGFQGMRVDAVSGESEADGRNLDVRTGTWDRPDPTGTVNGPNLYQGETGNPTSYADPSGLLTVVVAAPGAGAIDVASGWELVYQGAATQALSDAAAVPGPWAPVASAGLQIITVARIYEASAARDALAAYALDAQPLGRLPAYGLPIAIATKIVNNQILTPTEQASLDAILQANAAAGTSECDKRKTRPTAPSLPDSYGSNTPAIEGTPYSPNQRDIRSRQWEQYFDQPPDGEEPEPEPEPDDDDDPDGGHDRGEHGSERNVRGKGGEEHSRIGKGQGSRGAH